MAKGKLFEAWTFKQMMPKPFEDSAYAGMKDYGISVYNTTGSARKSSLHAPSLRALLAYASLVNASEAGEDTHSIGAIGSQGENYRIAELAKGDCRECVVFIPTTGKFVAGTFNKESEYPRPYTLGTGNSSGTALLFCLMPVFCKDSEFSDNFEILRKQMQNGWTDMEKAYTAALTLCDNIYRRVENAQNLGDAGVKILIPSTGNISSMSPLAFSSGNYFASETLYGKFEKLSRSEDGEQEKETASVQAFVGGYAFGDRKYTDRQKNLIPKLPDWYMVPEEVVSVCLHAKNTSESNHAMRNFMLRGEAGTGKTMSAQAIAAGLNLPYVSLTCSANTEIGDLVGQFVPEEPSNNDTNVLDNLPSVSDIVMHPPSVYKMLTGEYDETVSEKDVLSKLVEKAGGEKGKTRIRFVESPLVEAIRYGYLVEIQEPSCIVNPGVLVGLNALMDNCQTITLPTGEQIKRHPDTVIVVTTNVSYAGNRDINQSVLSRMDLIYDVETPALQVMAKRVMNITGFEDEQEAVRMAGVVRDIAERCRQTMITDGCCGMRELIAWVQSTMITKDVYTSALSTIIATASADPESRADLITTCLEKQYARTLCA